MLSSFFWFSSVNLYTTVRPPPTARPFARGEHPCSVLVRARRVGAWTTFNGTTIACEPPPSPVQCAIGDECAEGPGETLRLAGTKPEDNSFLLVGAACMWWS